MSRPIHKIMSSYLQCNARRSQLGKQGGLDMSPDSVGLGRVMVKDYTCAEQDWPLNDIRN